MYPLMTALTLVFPTRCGHTGVVGEAAGVVAGGLVGASVGVVAGVAGTAGTVVCLTGIRGGRVTV